MRKWLDNILLGGERKIKIGKGKLLLLVVSYGVLRTAGKSQASDLVPRPCQVESQSSSLLQLFPVILLVVERSLLW